MAVEPLAKDVLATLRPRDPLGARLVARVGRRAWERPAVAVSERIFLRYKLGDPWSPPESTPSLQLGPVSVRLGEKRQPARHLEPKISKKEAPPAPPAAATTKAVSPTPPAPKPPPPRPPEPPKVVERTGPPLKGKLPVRPDVAAPAPTVPPPKETQRPRLGGRLGLRASDATSPAVRPVKLPSVELQEPPPAPKAPPPRPVIAGDLDDLFGAAAEMGRMSLTKPKKQT